MAMAAARDVPRPLVMLLLPLLQLPLRPRARRWGGNRRR
jgi:hypothetical protein